MPAELPALSLHTPNQLFFFFLGRRPLTKEAGPARWGSGASKLMHVFWGTLSFIKTSTASKGANFNDGKQL